MNLQKYETPYFSPATIEQCDNYLAEVRVKHHLLIIDFGLVFQQATAYLKIYMANPSEAITEELSKLLRDLDQAPALLTRLIDRIQELEERKAALKKELVSEPS